uniref:Minor tail protein n=1 Tax=Siphoviridae sp. ctJ7x27 TaxID=2827835 RepID=A0A8S5S3Z4_9CAUD|nr:MAG TPA: minor tail protein [Siphoviridae sp. ctJ7x27]
MSNETREVSEFDAFPIELYQFELGTNRYYFTSADEDKTANNILYKHYNIKRSAVEQGQDVARSPITLTVSRNIPFLDNFRASPPTSIIMLKVFRYHEGERVSIPLWIGRVLNVKFTEHEAEIKGEPVFTSIKRPALRRRYQTTCPLVLYGGQCRLNKDNFCLTLSGVQVLDAVNITHPSFVAPNVSYGGGFLEYEYDGTTERRFIQYQEGAKLRLNLPLRGYTGQTMKVYQGCNHSLEACDKQFHNADNYGGQPFYPPKNPVSGTQIF